MEINTKQELKMLLLLLSQKYLYDSNTLVYPARANKPAICLRLGCHSARKWYNSLKRYDPR